MNVINLRFIKVVFILIFTYCNLSLQAIDYLKVTVKYEKVSDSSGYFDVEVKNMTDSILNFRNLSEFVGGSTFNLNNCYFVMDYIEKDGAQKTSEAFPWIFKNGIFSLNPNESTKDKYSVKDLGAAFEFTGILPPKYDLSKLSKVRFRLTKLDFWAKLSLNFQQNVEYVSNWISIN